MGVPPLPCAFVRTPSPSEQGDAQAEGSPYITFRESNRSHLDTLVRPQAEGSPQITFRESKRSPSSSEQGDAQAEGSPYITFRESNRSPSTWELRSAQATGDPTSHVDLCLPILTMPTIADPPTPLLHREGDPTPSGSNRQNWGDWRNSSSSLEASPVVSEYSRLSSNGSGSRNRRFESSPNYSDSLGSSSAAIWTPAVPPNQSGPANQSGSVSPVQLTYNFPSIEIADNMSSDGVSRAGYRNTAGSVESLSTFTRTPTPKYEEVIRNKVLATRKLDHAKFLKYQEEREKLEAKGVSDPQTAKFKTCDNALHIGNMAADVREIKEGLVRMMNERTEQLANSCTNAVPGLLSQISKELEQLNRTNNKLTEIIQGDENLIPREFSSTGTMTGGPFHGLGEGSTSIPSRGTSVRTAASSRPAVLTPGAFPVGNLPGPHSPGLLCSGRCLPPKVEPSSSAGPSCEKQPPQPLVQDKDLTDPEIAALKAKVASMTADLADKDAQIAAINVKLQDKEVEVQKQKVDISIANEQVLILIEYQEQVKRTLDTYTKMYVEKSQCIRDLCLRNDSLKNELAQAELVLEAKLAAPSPTLQGLGGLGASMREMMDFIQGDQVLQNAIKRRMFKRRIQELSNAIRKAGEQSGASTAGNRAGPSTVGQTKPLFGSPINRQLDSAGSNTGSSAFGQNKPLFGSTMNRQLDSAGSNAGPSAFGQNKPLFGTTMNRQLDSAGSNAGPSAFGQNKPLFGTTMNRQSDSAGSDIDRSSVGQASSFTSPIYRQFDSAVDNDDRSSISQSKPLFGRIDSLKNDTDAVHNFRQALYGGGVVPKTDMYGNSGIKSTLNTGLFPQEVDTDAISAARQRFANRKARFNAAVNRKADTAGHTEDKLANASAATAAMAATAIEKTKYAGHKEDKLSNAVSASAAMAATAIEKTKYAGHKVVLMRSRHLFADKSSDEDHDL